MVHFFDSDIAQKYGVNAAVLTAFLWDCVEQKSTESPQLHEGKVWVRCSVQMMTGFFPFLSYLAFANWLQENSEYKMATPMRQIVHRGPWNEDDPDKYLIELQIPLERA